MKLTGIYRITNFVNGKTYIGSSSKNVLHRIYNHIYQLKNQKHSNSHLQSAWNKYGSRYFTFEVLELCSPNECLKREQYYIDKENPAYNILKIAGSSRGHKMSEAAKINIGNGVKRSLSYRRHPIKTRTSEDIRIYNREYKRKKRATKNRLSKDEISLLRSLSSKNKRAIIRSDGERFVSVGSAAKILKCDRSEIRRAIKRNLRVRGYSFKYIND